MRLVVAVALLVLAVSVLLLNACSGGGTGEASARASDCQTRFHPDRLAEGQDCTPRTGEFCALMTAAENLGPARRSVLPCAGVTISEHRASGGGFETDYLAIRPDSGPVRSVYLALHYLGAQRHYFANLTRLAELAKARQVLVLVPQAPGGLAVTPVPLPGEGEDQTVSRWPTTASQPVARYLALLDAVLADARSRFAATGLPLYAAGLSNGAPMAYFLACDRALAVEAILAVAGAQSGESAAACAPQRPVGLVIIHGGLDSITPYDGLAGLTRSVPDIYADFARLNGCDRGQDRQAVLQNAEGTVELGWSPACADGRRQVLARAVGNGHNWPGDDTGSSRSLVDPGVGIFGPTEDAIDATLQGYDLLEFAA
ncbi:MAG TPA: hypothetical protein VFV27_09895, partial [Nevskiaceae bacterium]|nr:hypothetical protein [Nevskiaceae bacterium]